MFFFFFFPGLVKEKRAEFWGEESSHDGDLFWNSKSLAYNCPVFTPSGKTGLKRRLIVDELCVCFCAFRWCPMSFLYKLLGQGWICVTLDQLAGLLMEPRHKDAQVLLNARCAPLSWGQIFSCWVCYHKSNSEWLRRISLSLRGGRNLSVTRDQSRPERSVGRRNLEIQKSDVRVYWWDMYSMMLLKQLLWPFSTWAVQCIWCRQSNPDSVPSKGFSL